MAITIQQIKELREATAAGMGACKEALTATNGNMEEAVKYLREKGLAVAAKRVDNKNSALDFDKIREHLDMLDDLESVKTYYEELRKIHQSPAQEKYINGMFNKKKAQIAKD